MRLQSKIFLVGGLPIAVAALIALAAWLLLAAAERARGGALLAGAFYRDLLVAMAERDAYVAARPLDRDPHARRFGELGEGARARLDALDALTRDEGGTAAVAEARSALARYAARMGEFMALTRENDALAADMAARAATLIALTDQARLRQHASNADIIASLSEKDRRLRRLREVIDRTQDVRASVAALDSERLRVGAGPGAGPAATAEASDAGTGVSPGPHRLAAALAGLGAALREAGRGRDAADFARLDDGPGDAPGGTRGVPDIAAWCDRLLAREVPGQRALHEEIAQLLAYTVRANEAEQATQNIAIAALGLGRTTDDALARRDVDTAGAMLEEGRRLARAAGSLAISPLIQGEMIDAIDDWRERLGTTVADLRRQGAMLADMDRTAGAIVERARLLDELFTGDAERFAAFIRRLLLVGATLGLLLGSAAAIVVARSITGPLRRLQGSMVTLAEGPGTARGADPEVRLPDADRRDELGDMARAANVFVTEIGRRERALRRAKERADAALDELRRTQAELVRAEKLASLGQLVAGIAHEINTPLGIALTTATLVRDEAGEFERTVVEGQLSRSRLNHFVGRVREGAHLLCANLVRAADLVQSFKQVAVDQMSDKPRPVEVRVWLDELLRSLGPLLRRGGHAAAVTCPDDLVVDTHPGALAQVVTNLVKNAVVHAFEPGRPGRLAIAVAEAAPGLLALEVRDDGRGIPADARERVFDPFYTTARNRGSTGLGLHIVHTLVTDKLRGRIEVESEPGRGTTFHITVPVGTGPAGAAPVDAVGASRDRAPLGAAAE